ncbi:hypothetical protein A8B75_02030 [Sphingomonadales bacterium EhC05]|nr:hypothetical protein A8B75_02030 [Sphingomonadales bacterium EhC05]
MIMKNGILISVVAALSLAACDEAVEAPVVEEKLGDYSALGTEPGWAAQIKGDQIIFATMEGNDFTLAVQRMKKTDAGWEVKGFSDVDNINIYISTGVECSDGMSDRTYADTVKVEASRSGTLNGCGGDFTEGPDGAP